MKSIDTDASETEIDWEEFHDGFDYISQSEGVKILDRHARKYLGMSGEEFLQRYEAGDLGDADCSAIGRVSMLIPFTKSK